MLTREAKTQAANFTLAVLLPATNSLLTPNCTVKALDGVPFLPIAEVQRVLRPMRSTLELPGSALALPPALG